MNTGSGHPGDRRDALTPEERALADRLARLGPQGEPSPGLDARILAAARAAASAPTPKGDARAPRAHARRRWPVALGTAATLAIVGGLAWQLRPVDDFHVDYSEAPRAVSGPSADAASAVRVVQDSQRASDRAEVPAAAAAEAAPPDEAAGQAATAVPAVAQPTPAPPPAPVADAAAQVDEQPRPAAFKRVPPPAEPPVVFDEPSPMDTPVQEARRAPPPPAPPAPAAPAPAPPPSPAPVREVASTPPPAASTGHQAATTGEAREKASLLRQQSGEAAARRTAAPQVATGTRTSTAKPADADAAANASALDRIQVTGARADQFGDQPANDLPPATADSPQVQRAWLQRVRQLVAEGRTDAARASLREYQHRYPKAVLPEDLCALLVE